MILGRYLIAVVAPAALVLAGCGSSHTSTATAPASSGSSSVGGSAAVAASGTPSAPATTAPAAGSTASAPASQISIPPNLCDATDAAQDAADAYMGALSAGNEKEALACVLPGTVPLSVTRSLLVTTKATAVYLPRDGFAAPPVFSYQGNGKSIAVTVSKESDGKFWVTKVVVSAG